METTTVVEEAHHSCSSNLVVKSVESPIENDSISRDLVNADDIDTRKCEHFSIRGYVSEMRKKDWTKIWPFALDGGRNILKEKSCKLPPLLVPKFRWWCCQNCFPETGDKGSINEERTVTNNSSKLKSFGSCSHVPSHGDAWTCSSNFQQAGKINVDSRKSSDIACVNVNIPVIVASLQLHNPDLEDNEIAGAKLPEPSVECIVKDATETHQTGKYACDQQMELVKGFESHGIASTVPNAIETHRYEHPSLELDDCDYASSESDEVLPGAVSGSLHRRKNRKVRLLTELLGKSKDEKTDLTSTEDSPSSTIPDASIGIDSIPASQGQVNFQGNATSSLARRKKRKMPQDEEWVPGEFMCSPSNGHRSLKSFNRDAETADGITSSDSEGTINRSSSQTPAKSNLVNDKVDKSPILGKKKNKKTHDFEEFPSLRLSRENVQKERQKKPRGDTPKTDDVSTSRWLNPIPEFAAKAEKKSNLLKKKNKIHQDHDWQASRVPWNNGIPREVTENGLQSSLSNCLPVKRYDAKYSSPIREGQGHVLSGYDTKRKDLNMNYVSQADAYVWKGMHVDLNSNQTTYRTPFLKEKQERSPAEVGSSLIQLMDFSGTRNNGTIVEFQDHATVSREHYDKRVEIASEQGAVDDIMEIAELMAKNQYERCLPDTEIDKQLRETSNAKNHQMVDLNKAYGNEEMNLFQETADKPKLQAKNGRIDKFLRGDNGGSSKQKSVDYFSHMDRNQCSMSQLEQSYSPAGFKSFPLCGEKPLNGVQFSATNSIEKNSAQNCQWVGNMAAQKTSHANLQVLAVCNTCHRSPQQNKEAAHLWPSMMPYSMPYMPSIPHKCADQVTKLDVPRHCPSSLPKVNMSRNDDRSFLNLGSNYEKQCRKFDSEALRRTHADYPFFLQT
ncbi:Embryonic flower 1, putative isoform 2 [Hibiscus syriacus]|uniref:Embryonic flower 1, putative isoform 2 n=1 Tax=Hibiscus syriacus TaxID=106335 RepID=A0A6A3B9Y3_HIBSY|nr:Embryonic flower 1, putative isoform 2 [Hibiscus syriacus]